MSVILACGVALIFFLLTGCMERSARDDFAIANKIIAANDKRLSREGIECFGSGGSFCGTIRLIHESFSTEKYKFDSIADARVFFCKFFDDYARPFNEERRIRPYLLRFPVDAHMLQLSVTFRDGDDYCHPPYLVTVGCVAGKLYYSQYDPATGRLFDIYEEPFERAQRIVAGEEVANGEIEGLLSQQDVR